MLGGWTPACKRALTAGVPIVDMYSLATCTSNAITTLQAGSSKAAADYTITSPSWPAKFLRLYCYFHCRGSRKDDAGLWAAKLTHLLHEHPVVALCSHACMGEAQDGAKLVHAEVALPTATLSAGGCCVLRQCKHGLSEAWQTQPRDLSCSLRMLQILPNIALQAALSRAV